MRAWRILLVISLGPVCLRTQTAPHTDSWDGTDQMENQDIIRGLWNLACGSAQGGESRVTEAKIIEVLDALIASDDMALMELFPVFLYLSEQSGVAVDLEPLFAKYGNNRRQSERLEKLFLVTVGLLREAGMPPAPGTAEKEKRLLTKWGDLVSSGVLELENGFSVQIAHLRNAFRHYTDQPLQVTVAHDDQGQEPSVYPQLSSRLFESLRLLFSPKQQDLIVKKLRKEPFTKTEREYYSRVVKKKLAALADTSVQEIAATLVSK